MAKNRADSLKFKAIRTALLEKEALLIINFRLLNRKGSPFFNPWENVLPLIFIAVFAMVLMFSSGILTGILTLLIGIVAYLKLFPWVMKDVMRQRVLLRLTKSIDEWDKLWKTKGIIIAVADNPRKFCKSPDDDWRDFVVINFSEFMTNKKT